MSEGFSISDGGADGTAADDNCTVRGIDGAADGAGVRYTSVVLENSADEALMAWSWYVCKSRGGISLAADPMGANNDDEMMPKWRRRKTFMIMRACRYTIWCQVGSIVYYGVVVCRFELTLQKK